MAEQAYAYVTLIPVAKGFKSAISKELNAGAGVGATAGASAGKGFSGGFGKALGGLAAVAGTALAGIGISKFFKDSITQASDLGESVNAVNVAYGEFAGDVLKLGDGVAKRLGLSTVDFNAAAVRFSAFAGKIAGDGGDVAGVVDSLAGRAADFASVFNIEVSEALQVFQSGLAGEAEPLKRFGINLLDSEVKAFAYASGIAAVGSQLTETEKVQARYGLLLQETAKTEGDFANTSDGLANSQRILAASVVNLKAQIGEGLAPVVATLTSAMVPLVEHVFPKIAEFVNNRIVPGLELFSQYFSDLVLIGTTLGADNVIAKIFRDITESVKEFFAGDTLENVFESVSEYRNTFFNAILEVVPAILDAFLDFLPTLIDFFANTMLPQMVAQFQTILNEVISLITRLLPELITSLLSMVPDLLHAAIALFKSLVQAVIDITPNLLDAIVYLLPSIVRSVLSMLPSILDAAIELFTAIVRALPQIVPALINAILDLLPVIIDTVIDMLPELIDAAFDLFFGIVTAVYKATPEITGAIGELIPKMIGTLLGAIPQFFNAAGEIIAGFVRGLWENGPKAIGDAFSGIIGGAIEGVKGLLGIRSPSKVFEEIGENVGQGLVNGMLLTKASVAEAAKALAQAAVPNGFEWVQTSSGPTLMRTAFTQGNFASATGDPNRDQAAMSRINIQRLLREQGYPEDRIDDIFQKAVGGTVVEVMSAFDPSTTFYNAKTGYLHQISGGIPASRVGEVFGDLAAKGFEPVKKIAAPLEDVSKALEDLFDTVASGNVRNYLTPFAKGGLVTGPTRALIGEAGPEVVIPLDRFESMMGMSDDKGKTVNYYAAPNQSIDSEQALFQAMRRAKVVANW
jgi:phage-related protein